MLRPAVLADAPAISQLIHTLMPYLTLHPAGQGAEHFMASMALPAIERYLAEPNYTYRVGMVDGTIAGVVAIRDNRHVFHLFVAQRFHGQGIGRQLWHAVRDAALIAGNPGEFTVNASRNAVPVYQRFGFVATAEIIEEHGIAYLPMRLKVAIPD